MKKINSTLRVDTYDLSTTKKNRNITSKNSALRFLGSALVFLFLIFSQGLLAQFTPLGPDINGEAAGDLSGFSVSLSSDGQTMAIGAVINSANGTDAGHVRVYEWSGIAWNQKGLDIDGEAAGDNCGFSVSLSSDGQTLAVGANNNDANGTDAGHVRVYEWSGTAWDQLGLDIDGEFGADNSGRSISLSSDGQKLAIGANFNGGNGFHSGHVRVYEWSGIAWEQLGLDIDGESTDDQSAWSVSLSSDGQTLAISSRRNDDGGTDAGHVRVYEWDGVAWDQLGLDIDGEAAGDLSGQSVSLSSDGQILAIGASFNDGSATDAGQVRVYEWSGIAWDQLGLDIDGEAAGDNSGFSVSLSSDGHTLAIGARANDESGTDAGQVRIYEWSGTAWGQVGLDIDGEAAGDLSGFSISLSSDGQTLAIGAILNDGNGSNSGHVRVFGLATDTPPSITCPANNTVDNDANQCGAIVTFAATETVGIPASTITYSHQPGAIFPVGTTTVTATATNVVGTSECTFTITVNDTEAPTITCDGPVTINNTPGLCSGTTTLVEPTVIDNCTSTGNALNFDGTNDYVNAGLIDFSNTHYTIEGWFNTTYSDGIGGRDIMNTYSGGNIFFNLIEVAENGFLLYLHRPTGNTSTSIYAVTTFAVNDGLWHHFAAVYDTDNRIRLYVDGVLAATSTGTTSDISVSNTAVGIGKLNYNSGGRYFPGALDELRIWNTARTQSEIQAYMNIELSVETGLVASYHFNEGIADGNNTGVTTAFDASGNGNDGTLNNFALTGPTSNWVAGNAFSAPTVTNDAPATFPIGTTTVTWMAMDASGNIDSCTQDVTVIDNEDPVITECPGDISINNDSSVCGATLADYTSQVTFADNCPFATGFAKVSAGHAHTLALGPDGSLWAWGWNVYGEFGNGTTSPYTSNGGSNIPIKIGTDTDWVFIEAGSSASFAIKSDGTLWAWGLNSTGQLGDGTIIDKLTPVQIGTATNWVHIASSYRSTADVHTMGLQSNGTIWTWGANNTGQLGIGNNIYVTTPTQVGSSTDWASFDIGQFFSLAIKTNGTMWSWGSNYSFTLGTGTRFQNENSPVQIGTDNDWMRVEAGGDHGLAMKLDGTLWTWGSNQIGALAGVIGTSVGAAQRDPLQIGSATDWTSISAGGGFSLALKSNGELWASGSAPYYQRGPGATVTNALQQVGTATDWGKIETGTNHSTVFKTDGTLWAWGWNVKGQLGTGAPTSTIGYINPALVQTPVFLPVMQSPAPGTLLSVGENTITYTVADVAGNTATCTQVVTVVDNEDPAFTCPIPNVSYTADAGLCSASLDFSVSPTDNCGVASTVYSVDGSAINYPYDFPVGTTTVAILVTDIHDNTNDCSFDVVVTDNGLDCGSLFITKWVVGAGETITIPTKFRGYNYNVDWSYNAVDGFNAESANQTGNATSPPLAAGEHTVAINGDFPRIFFNNGGDKDKITEIVQWGTNPWTTMDRAFSGCKNLTITNPAAGTPNLSSLTNMSRMFNLAESFNGDVSDWDVSNVTNMSFLFKRCISFNQDLNTWDTSNVTKMEEMFNQAHVFNGSVAFDVSNVETMAGMFFHTGAFNHDLSNWDTSSVTNMFRMFNDARAFDQDLGAWDIGNVMNMEQMFFRTELSTNNYDNTLIGWAADSSGTPGDGIDDIPSNIVFEGGRSTYCAGEAARTSLESTYNWNITDSGLGCVAPLLGINSTNSLNVDSISLYPNPTESSVTIASLQTTVVFATVYDIRGRKVSEVDFRNQIKYQIDLTDMEVAIYFIEIATENGTVMKRVMKR